MKSLFFNIMKNALLEVGQLRRLAISPVFNSVYRSFKRKLQKNCIPLFVNSFFFTKQKNFRLVYIQCICRSINSIPKDKALSKLKAFADDKFNIAKMMISLFDRVENIVGKRRKCWLPAFSPFPAMFSKGLFLRVVKSPNCVVKS